MVKTIYLTFAMLLLGISSFAQANDQERWFEVEVILFSQLHDKSSLKEQFSGEYQASLTSSSRPALELLQAYIAPQLSQLKSLLPGCLVEQSQFDLTPVPTQEALFTLKESLLNFPELDREDINKYHFAQTQLNEDLQAEIEQIIALNRQRLHKRTEVGKLQQRLANLWQLDHVACLLPGQVFNWQQQLGLELPQQASWDMDAVKTPVMPVQINGAQPEDSNGPYLIASDSLKLKNITKKLSNSRNFKPLLHLGWRQAGLSKNKAQPVRLYAGENLTHHYQQQLASYQQNISEQSTEIADHEDNAESLAQSQLQAQITEIISSLEQQDIDLNQTLIELDSPYIEQAITTSQQAEQLKPHAPKQNWFIDGLFRVHLNHYLFIDADLAVMERTLSDADYNPVENKQLGFKQNRRVISGEIHYFDHPYMGMIVQIRRYSRPSIQEHN
jgi:hypothetical protein